MTATRVNREPIVQAVSLGSVNIQSNESRFLQASAPSIAGYTPTNIVSATWSHPSSTVCSPTVVGGNVYVNLRNYHTAAQIEVVTAYVLYLPN